MKIILIFFIFLWGFPLSSWARQWDPRLSQISDLAYQGNTTPAASLAESYLKENPEDPNAFFLRAMVYDMQRNLTSHDAEKLKEQSYKLYKKGNQIAFFKWEKAPENIDALIDLGNSYIFLGRILSDKGSWFRAIMAAKKGPKHLEKALQISPTRTDGLMALGVFKYVADNTPPAAAPFKKLFGIQGSQTQGLQELKKALQGSHPFRNDALVALFYVHFNYDKNYSEALKYLGQLQTKFPENPLWPWSRAEVSEKQSKAQGLTAYLQMVNWCEQSHPGRCDNKFVYDSLFRAGKLAMEQKQYSQAITHLEKAISTGLQNHPHQHGEALLWMAEMSTNPEQAIKYYQRLNQVKEVPKGLSKEAKSRLSELCQDPNLQKVCRS